MEFHRNGFGWDDVTFGVCVTRWAGVYVHLYFGPYEVVVCLREP